MIILASGSWLRKTIMEASEFNFEVHTKNVDERAIELLHPDTSDEEVAMLLSSAKASAVLADHPNDFVISADSFVVLPNGERLHKPSTAEEAVDLCLIQSGKTISAVTGIAMAYKDSVVTRTTVTKISYVDFDRRAIEKLLATGDATIRNAGLGLFLDAPGFTLVKDFRGSYTGAMGLPMEIVRETIQSLGYTPF